LWSGAGGIFDLQSRASEEVDMTLDELKDKARAKVETDNPGNTNFKAGKVLENILDGTLISVTFQTSAGKEDSNHVLFNKNNEMRTYRWHGDVLNAVAGAKERVWFFRFIELAGIGGVIAFGLIVIFAIFLCALAFANPDLRPAVLEVVKLSFTTILGYFFGSQAAARK
jgi:hypothetical protein